MTPEEENVDQHNVKVGENILAAQIFELLEHYKQEDPVGIPTAPIEDPMDVPDMTKSMGLATLRMKAIKSYGLSKFRIKSVKADLKEMKVRKRNRMSRDKLEAQSIFICFSNVFN